MNTAVMKARVTTRGATLTGERSVNSLLLIATILLATGLLMMTSASVEIAEGQYGDPLYFLKRQGIFALLGVLVVILTLNIPMQFWYRASWFLLMASIALLLLVLVPGIGKIVNGSARWIDLGLFNLQPSELAKVFVVIYLAAFLHRHGVEVREQWSGFLKPLAVIVAIVVLLEFEPDHGAMVIVTLTCFCMIFLAGAKLIRFVVVLAMCAVGVVSLAITKPYVLDRFSSFMNPWAAEYVYGDGYQLTQALIAFGRGSWFGTGLGNSIQKLYFLPEAHTDFVLAIIAEELGLVGVTLIVALFCMLIGGAFAIAMKAHRKGLLFPAYTAYGIALLFAGQTLINIGVNTGLLPTKGLTLPFLSYGGASLIVSCFMVALLVRIQYEIEQAGQSAARARR
ncbi:MAG: putative lipid II flippase FtsW [Pseudohongiellaceae bacterium]